MWVASGLQKHLFLLIRFGRDFARTLLWPVASRKSVKCRANDEWGSFTDIERMNCTPVAHCGRRLTCILLLSVFDLDQCFHPQHDSISCATSATRSLGVSVQNSVSTKEKERLE